MNIQRSQHHQSATAATRAADLAIDAAWADAITAYRAANAVLAAYAAAYVAADRAAIAAASHISER